MAWDEALLSGAKAVKALLTMDWSRQIDRVRIDQTLQTLRQIFFQSSDLIKVLEDIEAGDAVDREVVEFFATEFERIPSELLNAMVHIENEQFEDRNILRIADLNVLRQIKDGKIDTRREINRFFRSYLEGGTRRRNQLGEEASRVLAQIARLNGLIEKLEDKLFAARGMGRTATRRSPTRVRTRDT